MYDVLERLIGAPSGGNDFIIIACCLIVLLVIFSVFRWIDKVFLR